MTLNWALALKTKSQGWLIPGELLLQAVSSLLTEWSPEEPFTLKLNSLIEAGKGGIQHRGKRPERPFLASQPLDLPAGRAYCNCRCAGCQPNYPGGRGQNGWEICGQFVLADWQFLSWLGGWEDLFCSDPQWQLSEIVAFSSVWSWPSKPCCKRATIKQQH